MRVLTPHHCVAHVTCTRIAIVAGLGRTGQAHARRADVCVCADVAIVTESCHRIVHTPFDLVTDIFRANVAVTAVLRLARDARAISALLALRTDVAIFAWKHVVCEHTAELGIATIGRAQISIIALLRRASFATTESTRVAHGTRITVFTRRRRRCIATAHDFVARIQRARILVVTVECETRI